MNEVKRAPVLHPSNINLAEQWRQDWVISVPDGEDINDVLSPGYWAHACIEKPMQQFDRIEARAENGEWVADLLVVAVGRNWVTTHLIAKHDLAISINKPGLEKSEFEVVFKGPRKFCVKRLSDEAIVQEGIATKLDAYAWVENHERMIARTG
jgi:hypothetical protein